MTPEDVSQFLTDLWPNEIPLADYGRAARLILRLSGQGGPRVVVAPKPQDPVPQRRGPGRPKGSQNAPRRGRPAKTASKPAPADNLEQRVADLLTEHPDGMTAAQLVNELEAPQVAVYAAANKVAERHSGRFVLPGGITVPSAP
jgi:hypothetical protein